MKVKPRGAPSPVIKSGHGGTWTWLFRLPAGFSVCLPASFSFFPFVSGPFQSLVRRQCALASGKWMCESQAVSPSRDGRRLDFAYFQDAAGAFSCTRPREAVRMPGRDLAWARQEVRRRQREAICPSKQDETRSARRRWRALPGRGRTYCICLRMRLQTCPPDARHVRKGRCWGRRGDGSAAMRRFVYVPDGGFGNGLAAREKQQELAPPEAGCASGTEAYSRGSSSLLFGDGRMVRERLDGTQEAGTSRGVALGL